MNTTPRALRNNNPLNIRKSKQVWIGEVEGCDKKFVTFLNTTYGFRAAFIILRRYIDIYRLNTIRKIIERWAPPVENSTNAYIKLVSAMTKINENEIIEFSDKEKMINIVYAMAYVEAYKYFDKEEIRRGYEAAA